MRQFLTIVGVYLVLAMGVVYIAQQYGDPERATATRAMDARTLTLAN